MSSEAHWAHLRRVMGAVLQSPEQRLSIWDEHERLAEAIASGDVQVAVSISDEHMRNARQKLLSRLEEILEC